MTNSLETTGMDKEQYELKHVLKPIHLWGIAVGLVISGHYIGWNFGLGKTSPMGMVLATLVITLMYVAFIFSYTELTTAIPNSGGPYAYARRALGPFAGFIAGFATLVEFVFAPPAIALAIGSYVEFILQKFGTTLPGFIGMQPKVWIALLAFAVFIAINLMGVAIGAVFELVVTIIAVVELVLFYFIIGPHIRWELILTQPLLPGGLGGLFAAIPFAIWFYLAIEGVAMSAEETANPQKDIPIGYISGLVTLVLLAMLTLICSTGVVPASELATVEKPLPVAVQKVLPAGHWITQAIAIVGVFGLIASFHGIILGYSRQAFALARAHYLPAFMAKLTPKTQVPHWALIVPGLVGALACLTAYTDAIITISAIGAIILYIISMISLIVLRRKEPDMERPYRAPFYPFFPLLALGIAVLSLISVIWFSFHLFLIALAMFALGTIYYWFGVRKAVEASGDLLIASDFEYVRKTGELPPLTH